MPQVAAKQGELSAQDVHDRPKPGQVLAHAGSETADSTLGGETGGLDAELLRQPERAGKVESLGDQDDRAISRVPVGEELHRADRSLAVGVELDGVVRDTRGDQLLAEGSGLPEPAEAACQDDRPGRVSACSERVIGGGSGGDPRGEEAVRATLRVGDVAAQHDDSRAVRKVGQGAEPSAREGRVTS